MNRPIAIDKTNIVNFVKNFPTLKCLHLIFHWNLICIFVVKDQLFEESKQQNFDFKSQFECDH